MAVKYKQKCAKCRKNYVIATWRQRYLLCYDCQKNELSGEIKDKKMKKLFDISEDFYKNNAFLRSIKINYLHYGNLTDKQLEAFKKAVVTMKKGEGPSGEQHIYYPHGDAEEEKSEALESSKSKTKK